MQEFIFIYDHTILKGKEDSDYDPTDAIMYFYPPTVSMEFQHSLCSHVMGTCQILSNMFQSPPSLFCLDTGAKVACIHEPANGLLLSNIGLSVTTKSQQRILSFALYSESNATNNNIEIKCKLLYESFLFYMNDCLFCIFKSGKARHQSNFITQLFDKLTQLLSSKEKIINVFALNPFCKPFNRDKKMPEKLNDKVNKFMNDVCNEIFKFNIKILGGVLFNKKQVIKNQLPIDILNLLSLIIDCTDRFKHTDQYINTNQLLNPIKKNIVNIEHLKARQGVFLLKVCVTHKSYVNLNPSDFHEENHCYCCDNSHCHFLLLYLEHHSETTVIFVIDECKVDNITKEVLKRFSHLCFTTLSEIEGCLWLEDSMECSENRKSSISLSNNPNSTSSSNNNLSHEWKLVYNESNLDLKITNIINQNNHTNDWADTLQSRILSVYEVMKKESDLKEIQIKFPKESISVIRNNEEQIFSVKKYN